MNSVYRLVVTVRSIHLITGSRYDQIRGNAHRPIAQRAHAHESPGRTNGTDPRFPFTTTIGQLGTRQEATLPTWSARATTAHSGNCCISGTASSKAQPGFVAPFACQPSFMLIAIVCEKLHPFLAVTTQRLTGHARVQGFNISAFTLV